MGIPAQLPAREELPRIAEHACLVAMDAAFNFADYINNGSAWAFRAIKDCEKELDRLERQVDEELPGAITQVKESKARELLACLKFITDLERIGDLLLGAAHKAQQLKDPLTTEDKKQLSEMASILRTMLNNVHQGFTSRDLKHATTVLKSDTGINHLRDAIMRRYLRPNKSTNERREITVMMMAQSLERAGDHAQNLAEELFHLVRGHSFRHHRAQKRTES